MTTPTRRDVRALEFVLNRAQDFPSDPEYRRQDARAIERAFRVLDHLKNALPLTTRERAAIRRHVEAMAGAVPGSVRIDARQSVTATFDPMPNSTTKGRAFVGFALDLLLESTR